MGITPGPLIRAVPRLGLALASAAIVPLERALAAAQVEGWSAVLDLSVGGEADTDIWFSRTTDLAVGCDGRIYVLDSGVRMVHVFDDGGRSIGSIGRHGGGPGEFEIPSAVGWHGDTLWVSDRRLFRLSLFTPDGQFITARNTYWAPGGQDVPVSVHALLADGTLLGMPRGKPGPGDSYPSRVPLLRLAADADVVDTLAVLSNENSVLDIRYRGARYFRDQPFADGDLWGISTDGGAIVIVHRSAARHGGELQFQVTRLTAGGDTIFRKRYGYQRDRVADHEIESAISTISSRLVRMFPSEDAAKRAVQAALYIPAYRPPVTAVVAGRDGTTWLRRDVRVDSDCVVWMALDERGNAIGEIQLNTGIRILEADREFIWGTGTTSLGTPYVVRYRLTRGH